MAFGGPRSSCVRPGAHSAPRFPVLLHRHHFVRSEGNIQRLPELMHHSDIRITASVCAHLVPVDAAEVSALLLREGDSFSFRFHVARDGRGGRQQLRAHPRTNLL